MRVVSLFTGVGGMDLGLQQAGHEIILQCESDPGARQVLRRAFPGVLLEPDAGALRALPPGTELVAAAPPAGGGGGGGAGAALALAREGGRAGADPECLAALCHLLRLLERAALMGEPVPWVLIELPPSALEQWHGDAPLMASIAADLERIGYPSWAQRTVDVAAFGAPLAQRRALLVASRYGDARDVLLADGRFACRGACMDRSGACWECYRPEDKARPSPPPPLSASYALDPHSAGAAPGVDAVAGLPPGGGTVLLLDGGEYGLLRAEDAERLQGLPEGHTRACWPLQVPGVAGHRDRQLRDQEAVVLERKRAALISGATNVRAAAWVGERLASPCAAKFAPSAADVPLPAELQAPALKGARLRAAWALREDALRGAGACAGGGLLARGTDAASGSLQQPGSSPQEDGRHRHGGGWPAAAWYIKGQGRFATMDAAEAPVKAPFVPLGDFIEQVGRAPDVPLFGFVRHLRERGVDARRDEAALAAAVAAAAAAAAADAAAAPDAAAGAAAGAGVGQGGTSAGVGAVLAQQASAAAGAAAAARIGILAWGRVRLRLPQRPPGLFLEEGRAAETVHRRGAGGAGGSGTTMLVLAEPRAVAQPPAAHGEPVREVAEAPASAPAPSADTAPAPAASGAPEAEGALDRQQEQEQHQQTEALQPQAEQPQEQQQQQQQEPPLDLRPELDLGSQGQAPQQQQQQQQQQPLLLIEYHPGAVAQWLREQGESQRDPQPRAPSPALPRAPPRALPSGIDTGIAPGSRAAAALRAEAATAVAAAASAAGGGSAATGRAGNGDDEGAREAEAELWWPCEVVDPWAPPAGFKLRLQHLLALPPAMRAASVPPRELKRLRALLRFDPVLAAEAEPKPRTGGGAPSSERPAAAGPPPSSGNAGNGGTSGGNNDGAAAPPRAQDVEASGGSSSGGTRDVNNLASSGGAPDRTLTTAVPAAAPGAGGAPPPLPPPAPLPPPPPLPPRSTVAAVVHAAAAAAEAAAAAKASEGPAAPPPGHERLLLVLWFGGGSFEWRRGKELLPFRKYRRVMRGHARALLEEGLLVRRYTQAFAEADAACRTQADARPPGTRLLFTSADARRAVREAAAARAAEAAAAAAEAAGRRPLLRETLALVPSHVRFGALQAPRPPRPLPAPPAGGGGRLLAHAAGGFSLEGGGGGGARRRPTPHAGGFAGVRGLSLLPAIERCGECRTCQNRSLKKACVRNKELRDEMIRLALNGGVPGFAPPAAGGALPAPEAGGAEGSNALLALSAAAAAVDEGRPRRPARDAEEDSARSKRPKQLVVAPPLLLGSAAATNAVTLGATDAAAAAAAAAGAGPSNTAAADATAAAAAGEPPPAHHPISALVTAAAARGIKFEIGPDGGFALHLPPSRKKEKLPNMQRCGACESCLNRRLKRACVRNQSIRDAMEAAAAAGAVRPPVAPAPASEPSAPAAAAPGASAALPLAPAMAAAAVPLTPVPPLPPLLALMQTPMGEGVSGASPAMPALGGPVPALGTAACVPLQLSFLGADMQLAAASTAAAVPLLPLQQLQQGALAVAVPPAPAAGPPRPISDGLAPRRPRPVRSESPSAAPGPAQPPPPPPSRRRAEPSAGSSETRRRASSDDDGDSDGEWAPRQRKRPRRPERALALPFDQRGSDSGGERAGGGSSDGGDQEGAPGASLLPRAPPLNFYTPTVRRPRCGSCKTCVNRRLKQACLMHRAARRAAAAALELAMPSLPSRFLLNTLYAPPPPPLPPPMAPLAVLATAAAAPSWPGGALAAAPALVAPAVPPLLSAASAGSAERLPAAAGDAAGAAPPQPGRGSDNGSAGAGPALAVVAGLEQGAPPVDSRGGQAAAAAAAPAAAAAAGSAPAAAGVPPPPPAAAPPLPGALVPSGSPPQVPLPQPLTAAPPPPPPPQALRRDAQAPTPAPPPPADAAAAEAAALAAAALGARAAMEAVMAAKLERCGACRTCLQRSLKRGCLRNRAIRDEIDAACKAALRAPLAPPAAGAPPRAPQQQLQMQMQWLLAQHLQAAGHSPELLQRAAALQAAGQNIDLLQQQPRQPPQQQQQRPDATALQRASNAGGPALPPPAPSAAAGSLQRAVVAVATAAAAGPSSTAGGAVVATARANAGGADGGGGSASGADEDALLTPLAARAKLRREAPEARVLFVPPLSVPGGGAGDARCMQCEACTQSLGAAPRSQCLVRRAREQAAAGNPGGWLAAHGAGAIGARVSVYWPLDEAWYDGVLVDYDPVCVRHTVRYYDDDTELLRLWAPGTRVRAVTGPAAWPAEAARQRAALMKRGAAQAARAQAVARLNAANELLEREQQQQQRRQRRQRAEPPSRSATPAARARSRSAGRARDDDDEDDAPQRGSRREARGTSSAAGGDDGDDEQGGSDGGSGGGSGSESGSELDVPLAFRRAAANTAAGRAARTRRHEGTLAALSRRRDAAQAKRRPGRLQHAGDGGGGEQGGAAAAAAAAEADAAAAAAAGLEDSDAGSDGSGGNGGRRARPASPSYEAGGGSSSDNGDGGGGGGAAAEVSGGSPGWSSSSSSSEQRRGRRRRTAVGSSSSESD